MQDATEIDRRRKRCYDLVVQLGDLDHKELELDEQLREVKRRKSDLQLQIESERNLFVEDSVKAAASTAQTEEIERAEREWASWVSDARKPSTEARQESVEAADGLPVPRIQERVPASEPPRLRTTRRSKRSFSLTGPTAPSTPVRKRLEYDSSASGEQDELSPPSDSSSPAAGTTTTSAADSSTTQHMHKIPTPARAKASAQPPSIVVNAVPPTTSDLINELLNPDGVSKHALPSATVAADQSARVLFEE